MKKIYELASGNYLVTSAAGVQTVVFRRPYVGPNPDIVVELRLVADTIEAALTATAQLAHDGRSTPA